MLLLAVRGPKSMKFADGVGDPSLFPTPFPDCQNMFCAGDIGAQLSY